MLDYVGGSSCIPTNSVGPPSTFVANMTAGQPRPSECWDIHPSNSSDDGIATTYRQGRYPRPSRGGPIHGGPEGDSREALLRYRTMPHPHPEISWVSEPRPTPILDLCGSGSKNRPSADNGPRKALLTHRKATRGHPAWFSRRVSIRGCRADWGQSMHPV